MDFEGWLSIVEMHKNERVIEYKGGYTTPGLLPCIDFLPDEAFEGDQKPVGFFKTREECEEFVRKMKEHPTPFL